MKILGISAYYHDSAAAIVIDGKVVVAAQEERFSRIKHDERFPILAIQFCLEEVGLQIGDLDAIVFYDKPFLKFERLIETYLTFAPKGFLSFVKSMPVWLKEKLFLKKVIQKELKNIGKIDFKKLPLLFTEHHLSHAASAFYPSNFKESAILTIDGVGEWATASIGVGEKNKITIIKEMHFPDSVGLLYSAFTYYLGFKVNSGEYKLMGLAPYGQRNAEQTQLFIQTIKDKLVDIFDDGSIRLNQKYFTYATGLRMVPDKKWFELFGIERRQKETEINQIHCNLALAIQTVIEEIVLKLAIETKRVTGQTRLCLSGGVALNCVANGKLMEKEIFKEVFIQPASGDAGGAIGAALAGSFLYFDEQRVIDAHKSDELQGSYLGPEFDRKSIKKLENKFGATMTEFSDFSQLAQKTAFLISEGNVIGWFQGRMEFGPRALGNRSILADARKVDMQQKVNLKIKFREGFRPFAPSVLEEKANHFFDLKQKSRYMLLVHSVSNRLKRDLPSNFESSTIQEKLAFQKSDLPAITHVDFSARIQTVSAETNPRFHQLLKEFDRLTGVPIVLNTSFNVRGEPIVCTPEDAYRCFMRTEMDYLVIGDFLFAKKEQPKWNEVVQWQNEFELD